MRHLTIRIGGQRWLGASNKQRCERSVLGLG